jgi:hypothetical protein
LQSLDDRTYLWVDGQCCAAQIVGGVEQYANQHNTQFVSLFFVTIVCGTGDGANAKSTASATSSLFGLWLLLSVSHANRSKQQQANPMYWIGNILF